MSTPSIGIGITTKERWDDLAVTLEALRQNGLDSLETIVIDDGSRMPMPLAFKQRFPWVRFERCDTSIGYIAQRNRLARILTSQLYLSLDDDSYPAAGVPLDDGARWLAARDDAIALAFAIRTPSEAVNPCSHRIRAPYPVRHYIGCAHMLKRDLFLAVGGYTESLIHYCEETDLALKAWKRGFKVYKYPSVVVIHGRSAVGRNAARANRLLARNLIWVSSWRSPVAFFAIELLFRVFRMLRCKAHRAHWQAVLRGYFEALAGLPSVTQFRDPLTITRYAAWLKNPVELR